MIGTYKGFMWVRKRHGAVFPCSDRPRSLWYFLKDNRGELTGDHFRTQRELQRYLDSLATKESR